MAEHVIVFICRAKSETDLKLREKSAEAEMKELKFAEKERFRYKEGWALAKVWSETKKEWIDLWDDDFDSTAREFTSVIIAEKV